MKIISQRDFTHIYTKCSGNRHDSHAAQCPFLPTKDAVISTDVKPVKLHQSRLVRALFFMVGMLFLILGMVGVIVPGLPTTVFVLLAAYCWMRSSERFYAWIMNHRQFGKLVRDWQMHRAMPRTAKYMAWGMMTVSTLILAVMASMWAAGVMAVVTVLVGIWMYRLADS